MAHPKSLVLMLLLPLLAANAFAQEPIAIQGIWKLVSQKLDGQVSPPINMLKTITKGRWSWIQQDKDKMMAQLAKKTHEDSLKAYANYLNAGYGTYTLAGDTYTETIEYMSIPSFIGRSIPFKVKIEGGHLYQTGEMQFTDEGGNEQKGLLEEEYQRLE